MAWNLELHYSAGEYGGETVQPTLIINYIKTKKHTPAELQGESLKAGSIEECEEREDEFYIFEHEPMFKFSVKIKNIKDGKALVFCLGTAVENGYAEKPKKVKFDIEEWVTIGEMTVNEDFSDGKEEPPAPADGMPINFIPNGGANPEDLETVEKLAGFTFPDDMRKFLLESNGAPPRNHKEPHYSPHCKGKTWRPLSLRADADKRHRRKSLYPERI